MLACAVRLLDRGFFRIGGEDYAESNDSYGLATMRKKHVTLTEPDTHRVRLPGEERQARVSSRSSTRRSSRSSQTLKRRRGGGDELLAYKAGRRWTDVRSEDINGYIKEIAGEDFSAKDVPHVERHRARRCGARGVRPGRDGSKTARKRAVTRVP